MLHKSIYAKVIDIAPVIRNRVIDSTEFSSISEDIHQFYWPIPGSVHQRGVVKQLNCTNNRRRDYKLARHQGQRGTTRHRYESDLHSTEER